MRTEKVQLVNDIGGMLNESKYVFLITYKGISVKDFSSFRSELASLDSECHVLKNRLIKKAAEIHGPKGIAEMDLKGDSAVIIGQGDPGAVAKAIDKFSSSNNVVSAKGGFLDGEVLAEQDVKAIADLPSKEVLYAMLLGVIQAPARNLVSVLNNSASSIVNVLNAYKNKLEE